jgi:SAM-dependent methyltransferase
MTGSCTICGQSVTPALTAPERMFGLGGAFTYGRCAGCGVLVLLDPPDDLAPFYPSGYYAFEPPPVVTRGRVDRFLRRNRVRMRRLPKRLGWMNGLVGPDSRIVDYGSGTGAFVADLRRQGLDRAVGVDAFAPAGPYVQRELPHAPIDLVTMHHSLEHIPDQRAVLRRLSEHQSVGGHLFIRTPLADSFAAQEYGSDWVQLDPPRHLVVHTPTSLRRLLEAAGYTLVRHWRDSTGFQFWGSELYRRGLTLADPRTPAHDGGLFSAEQLRAFEMRAAELNAAGRGDQGCFLFRRDAR